MADQPEPADPALERLARAVEVGTFRALTRFAVVVTVAWMVLAVVVPVLFMTVSRSVEPPVFVVLVAATAGLLALVALRTLRPRI